MLSLVWQYDLPLSLPYVTATNASGLLDVSVVLFFFFSSGIALATAEERLCKTLLRVYCEERYSSEQKNFLSMRWGLNPLYDELTANEYMGRGLVRTWRVVNLAIGPPVVFASLISVLVGLGIALWGMWHVLWHPAFGAASVILVVIAFGQFISRWLGSLFMTMPGLHNTQESEAVGESE
jgi:hypothetical protein